MTIQSDLPAVQWKLFADLRTVTDSEEVTIDSNQETVGDALDALLASHPELEDRVLEDGRLREDVNVLRNGQSVRPGDGLATSVEENDELALFPPMSGG